MTNSTQFGNDSNYSKSNGGNISANCFMVTVLALDGLTKKTLWSLCFLEIFPVRSPSNLLTRLYDKRNDFDFHTVKFPFLFSNIPSGPSYGVYISQLIRYARYCSHYDDSTNAWLIDFCHVSSALWQGSSRKIENYWVSLAAVALFERYYSHFFACRCNWLLCKQWFGIFLHRNYLYACQYACANGIFKKTENGKM